MIVHIVLLEPRADLTEADRQQVLDDLRVAARSIPTLRRCRIGRRIHHHLPGYEQAMAVDYQYTAIMEFDDREGLEAYLQHPAHAAAGRHFTQASARALAYDYEIGEEL